MPIKHQSNSYRNRKGIKYICWSDCAFDGEAKKEVKLLRDKGYKAFKENNEYYYRVFVEELYLQKFKTGGRK